MSFFTLSMLQTALEQGCILSLVTLALYISFTTLNLCDLATDGTFTLGCAVSAQMALTFLGHPVLALFASMAIGCLSGLINATLQTKLKVESILAGIIVNTGLYTINLWVMGLGSSGGFSSNVNMNKAVTIFDLAKDLLQPLLGSWYKLAVLAVFALGAALLIKVFMGTRLGLSIRATGDNADMVRASSINPGFTITAGLCLANALTGLAGALQSQYQKSCDINIGTGMVTIALASLIIGQTLVGRKGSVGRRILGVLLGSCLYRIIIAVALRMNMNANCLKLVSAIIVAIAIASPTVKGAIALQRQKAAAKAARKGDKTHA